MADVSAHTPVFSRGSAVLDYWLVHAEGLTVQPLGARVEEVVVAAPVGRAEALIVRSRMTRRRKAIPADSIAAVEPSTGALLLEAQRESGPRLRLPHLSPDRVATVRAGVGRGERLVRAQAAEGLRRTRAATVATLSWLRPRALQAGRNIERQTRLASVRTVRGIAWLAPRLAAGARTTGAAAARSTLTVAVLLARGFARTARELERAAAPAVERGRASLAARRQARRQRELDE